MVSRRSPLFRFSIVLLAIIAILSTSAFVSAPAPAESIAQDGLQVVQSSDGRVSMRLPADWVTIDLVAEEGLFVFGSGEPAAQGRLNDYRSEPALLVGEGGTLTIFSLADLGLSSVDADVLESFMGFILDELESGGSILEGPTEASFNNGALANYVLIQLGNETGYIGVLGFDEGVVLFTATGTNSSFAENDELLFTLVQNISIPAETGGSTPTNNVDVTDSNVNLFASSDGRMSVVVPDGWATIDQLATDNVLAFGNTDAGASTRRDVILADDPSTIFVEDSGGVIRILSSTENGIDPNNPDVMPLMQQIEAAFVSNGWELIESATSFVGTGDNPGAYIIFNSGPQYGYSVLVAFGEDLVLLTATGTTEAEFTEQRELLFSVVQSVSIPAAEPEANADGATGGKFPGLGGGPGVALPEIVSYEADNFLFSMPKDWVYILDVADDRFLAVWYVGENQAAAEASQDNTPPSDGTGSGLIILAEGTDFGGQTLDDLWTTLIPETADPSLTQSEQVNGNDIRWVVYDETDTVRSYYVLLETAEGDIVLMILGSSFDTFEEKAPLFEAIFRSVVHGEASGAQSGGLGSN